MSDKEDTIPEGYAYAWTLASDLSLEDFLKKACIPQLIDSFNTNTSLMQYKPSQVRNDGSKPVI